MPEGWHDQATGNRRDTEPSLDELFWDGAVQLLMRSDGVRERDVRALLRGVSDARAAASDGTRGRRAGPAFPDESSDREQKVVSNGSRGPPDAKKVPLRFI